MAYLWNICIIVGTFGFAHSSLFNIKETNAEVTILTLLQQQFNQFRDILKEYNIDAAEIKEKMQPIPVEREHIVAKRDTNEIEAVSPSDDTSVGGFLDSAWNTVFNFTSETLKSIIDVVLGNVNLKTNGLFRDVLINIEAVAYGIVDKTLRSTSGTYYSRLL